MKGKIEIRLLGSLTCGSGPPSGVVTLDGQYLLSETEKVHDKEKELWVP